MIIEFAELEFEKECCEALPSDPELALLLLLLYLGQEWMLGPEGTSSTAGAFPGGVAIRVPQLNQLDISYSHHCY